MRLIIEARRVLGVLVGVIVLAGCNLYGPGWSAVHSDGANSDYSSRRGPDDISLAWRTQFGGRINLGPVSGPDGQVYVTTGTATCPLHALDLATGVERWCSNEVNQLVSLSSPVVDRDGNLYVADSEAMHSFDSAGNLRWETPINGVPLSAQLTQNGRVLFITNIGVVYVLRRENGQPVLPPVELIPGATFDPAKVNECAWGTSGCPVANTPSIDLATGRFTFTFWAPGAASAGVRAMRVTEDPVPAITPLWTNESLPGGSASSPTLSADRSRVYVNDNVDSLHALDAATGEALWSFPIGFASGGSPSVTPGGLVMPSGGTASPLLAVQDEGDHASLAWSRSDLGNRGIPMQMAGNRSYATVRTSALANDLVVIDTIDGTELDREAISGNSVVTVGTTVGQDGTILVPTITGQLCAYRAD
jgi:outer membrane protein assembly factor BamB